MKKINILFLSIAALCISAVQAQTVDEIINKHIDALGGKDKVGQLKSIYVETSVEAMGNSSPSVENLVQGKGFKTETDMNGMKLINCYTDKSGWALNPFTGSNDPQALPDEAYKLGKDQIYFDGALIDYATKGYKVELAGLEGTNYKIKVTNGTAEKDYFIDAATYNVTKTSIKADFMGNSIEIVVTYSDYKKTDFGVAIPYTRTTSFGENFSMTAKVTKVEVNKDIDLKIFDMPK